MNKRQVIILWTIALALGIAVTAVKVSQKNTSNSATKRAAGETLFESFPAPQVEKIRIQGADDSVTLARKDQNWVVTDRDDYPADNTLVNGLLRTVEELKVTQGMEAGPSFAPRFGMDPESSDPENRGITVTFQDGSQKDLAAFSVGKNIESGASPSPMGGGTVGRFVRNHDDQSGFYAVSEMFPALTPSPAPWLSQEFVRLENIKSVSVTRPGGGELAWKVVRENETGDFSLENAQPGENLDPAAANPLKSLLAYARFEDVIPAAKTEERLIGEKTAVATIETFDGFTYTLQVSPTHPTGEQDPENPVPAGDTIALSLTVTADLNEEREKGEDESEEDAKTRDEAFAARLATLKEKLEKEKALEGRTYELSQYTLEALLKQREDLLGQEESADAGAPGIPPGGFPMEPPAPSGPRSVATPPIQAFTPPISIPPMEERETGEDEEEAETPAENTGSEE